MHQLFAELTSSGDVQAKLIQLPRTTLIRTLKEPALNGNALNKIEAFLRRHNDAAGRAELAEQVAALLQHAHNNRATHQGPREAFNTYANDYMETFLPVWVAAGSKRARAPIEEQIFASLSANRTRYGEHTVGGVARKMENMHKRNNKKVKVESQQEEEL